MLSIWAESHPELVGQFCAGAPCMITENIHERIPNGLQAEMHSLSFATPQPALRQKIAIAQPGEVIWCDPPLSVNVILESGDWPDTLCLGKAEERAIVPIAPCRFAQKIKVKKLSLLFKPHAVDLAFACTYHKVQGKTLKKVILDVNKPPGRKGRISLSALYVALTRVRRASDMRMLPILHNDFSYMHKLRYPTELKTWRSRYTSDRGEASYQYPN